MYSTITCNSSIRECRCQTLLKHFGPIIWSVYGLWRSQLQFGISKILPWQICIISNTLVRLCLWKLFIHPKGGLPWHTCFQSVQRRNYLSWCSVSSTNWQKWKDIACRNNFKCHEVYNLKITRLHFQRVANKLLHTWKIHGYHLFKNWEIQGLKCFAINIAPLVGRLSGIWSDNRGTIRLLDLTPAWEYEGKP